MRPSCLVLLLLCLGGYSCAQSASPQDQALQNSQDSHHTYLGFDRNLYPGDAALPILRETFAFSGYWLSAPPGETANSWRGKRELLRSRGFGFLLLYRGRDSQELKTRLLARQKGSLDARNAAHAARREGFSSGAVIFLDVEEGGRLSANYHSYLRAWADALLRAGYRPGVYCSGIPVNEGGGVSVTTASDIHDNLSRVEFVYWVYDDACPPSPGCATLQNPPPPSASGISHAAVWQFAQSPRRHEFTARCASTYHSDDNCYAPGDTAHAWHLDLNSSISPDPSDGAK